ncbi:MAG: SsgA family sporulation/cell division regulator [Actinophytocola sp.]|nr:SsgA family sporulation/cell division regulator [Actinophytocola sp.]
MAAACVERVFTVSLFSAPGSEAVRCRGLVDVVLRYAAADPYAVALSFAVAPRVGWRVSRELLTNGLSGPVGIGDVKVFPGPARVRIELASPTGRAAIFVHRTDLEKAIAATERLVRPGSEYVRIDWDRELSSLGVA